MFHRFLVFVLAVAVLLPVTSPPAVHATDSNDGRGASSDKAPAVITDDSPAKKANVFPTFKFKVNRVGFYMTCERAVLNGQKATGAEFYLDTSTSGHLFCLFPGGKKGIRTNFVCAKAMHKGEVVTMTLSPRNPFSRYIDCLTPSFP